MTQEKPIDPYRQRASELFGVRYEDVTKDQRAYAKAQAFGEAYGITTPPKSKDRWWVSGQPLTGKAGAECKDGWDD